MDSIKQYLESIKNINENVKEHTHRSALENLLKSIKDELATTHKDFTHLNIIHEPNNDKSENKAGAPDFLISYGSSNTSLGGGGQFNIRLY